MTTTVAENTVKPQEVKRVLIGSGELEDVIEAVVSQLRSWDDSLTLRRVTKLIGEDYLNTLMSGRHGVGKSREGSTAPDDTGGYLEFRNQRVVVTKKLIASCF